MLPQKSRKFPHITVKSSFGNLLRAAKLAACDVFPADQCIINQKHQFNFHLICILVCRRHRHGVFFGKTSFPAGDPLFRIFIITHFSKFVLSPRIDTQFRLNLPQFRLNFAILGNRKPLFPENPPSLKQPLYPPELRRPTCYIRFFENITTKRFGTAAHSSPTNTLLRSANAAQIDVPREN